MSDSDHQIDDAELAALALAADPDTVVPDDAVSLWDLAPTESAGLLPDWYMPAPAPRLCLDGWRNIAVRWTIGITVLSFVLIEAYGLCTTYGPRF